MIFFLNPKGKKEQEREYGIDKRKKTIDFAPDIQLTTLNVDGTNTHLKKKIIQRMD